jgi:prepilin-type N-terminal cleavage/methylation domain-containing protein
MKKEIIRDNYNKGFTLIELMIVIAVLSILVLIAVPLYKDYDEKATKQVCDTNCLQFERMYHIYLITENKEDTAYEFKYFLQKYEENICPVNGDIVYMHDSVRCLLHFEDETNENNNDEDDESVPFL